MVYTINIQTSMHSQMIDITEQINQCVFQSGITSGMCVVYCPHTTGGITINENADPDVINDILAKTDEIVPWIDNYRHFEGNSAAHIKAIMTGFSQTIIVENNKLMLGTWQGIYFVEFDGARNRTVYVKIIKG